MTTSNTLSHLCQMVLISLLPSLALTSGCGAFASSLDKNSGGDHVRGKAVSIQISQTHDDFVSAPDGDHTDWKSFSLPDATLLEVHAYWDNPDIEAVVNVRDQFGGRIFELKHARGQREDHWTDIRMRDGDFYLEIVAKRGASVYTLELKRAGDAPGAFEQPRNLAPPE